MSICVGIYTRLSDEDKEKKNKDDDSLSITNQKEMLVCFCKERGWNIYDIYCDDGYSGTDPNRPDFNRLIKDCEEGKINVVLCKDQSRFSRDMVTVEKYINGAFLEWGIRFIGVADNSDSNREEYDATRMINGMLNEMYVRDTSLKIRRTLQHKREQGQFTGSFAPFGYAIDPENKNHLVIDEEAALVIKQIFELYVSGKGYRKIVQTLNNQNIPSPSFYKRMNNSNYYNHNVEGSLNYGKWTLPTISSIVRNEVYIGTLVQGKTHPISYKNHKGKKVPEEAWIKIPNAHDAIIDEETWTRTQERLKNNGRAGSRTNELSPLSGIVKCAVCGSPMKRNVYYNKSRTIRYYGLQCGNYKVGSMCCSNTFQISGQSLERLLVDQINDHIHDYCCMDKITIFDLQQEKIRTLTERLNKATTDISAKEAIITKTYVDYAEGTISSETYKMINRKLEDELTDLKANCKSIREQIDKLRESVLTEEAKQKFMTKYSVVEKITRDVALDFFESIEVGGFDENNKRIVTVNWNI